MRRILVLSLLFFCALFGRELKIAAWNVENLFDLHYDATEYQEYVPGRHGWSEAMLRKKLRHLAEVICDLDADVIGLEEVESDRVLARLQRLLHRVGCPYRYRAITRRVKTPVHTALLSRIPLKRIREIPVTRGGRQRSILEAVLDTEPTLRIFVNHWRSKAGPESERMVYARALRRRLERLSAGSEYLVLGDFNEGLRLDRKLDDTEGRSGLSTVLGTSKSGYLLHFDDLHEVRGFHLLSLWSDLPVSERWSHNFYGEKEALDAILIPPALMDGRAWEYRRRSFGVFRPKYLLGKYGWIRRWEYRHGHHTGRGYSDHLPIYCRVALSKDPTPVHEAKGFWDRVEEGVRTLLDRMIGAKKETPMPLVSSVSSRSHHAPVKVSDLLASGKVALPVLLKGASVVYTDGRGSAVVCDDSSEEGLLLYRCAAGIEAGKEYDLKLYGIKEYHGMREVTDLRILGEGEKKAGTPRCLGSFSPALMKRKSTGVVVVGNLEGIYLRHRLQMGAESWPIYFRNRRWRPKEGSHLNLKRALIGYYNGHRELQVWSKKDFEIEKR